MTLARTIPLSIHGGLEAIAGPALMAAPFLLGFGTAATAICVIFGVLVLGLALQVPGPERSIPLAVHAAFDYALAIGASVAGIAIGLVTGDWAPTALLVGLGAAQVTLTASTRFSVPYHGAV